jgi:hypothetical protein
VGGESTIAAETGSRKRPAADMASTAEMRAAKMPTAMAAATEMRTTPVTMTAVTAPVTAAPVTAAPVTAAAMATAAFRSGIPGGRQHGRENNDGNPNIEF